MSFAAVLERLQILENPYPGLRPFETRESHLFFGRDLQVAELVGRLERQRFVAVLGVSGSGKSSLVRAGLIPALERGRISEAGRRWRMVVTRPSGAPFESLGTDLGKAGLDTSRLRESSHGLIEIARQLSPEESLLVVVDQFEELFRYKDVEPITVEAQRMRGTAAADAAEFVQMLLTASRDYPPVYIVLTMRSDYLGDCAEFRDLPEALNDGQYLVPRMTREQRKEAIEGPLGRVEIAASLVQRMLNDAGDEPDQLPILQHALMRTWSHRRTTDRDSKRPIELQDYEGIAGFNGALNLHADELLAGVPYEIAEPIFKRLTARGRGNRERREPARLAELWAVCGAETPERQAQVTAVIDHFRRGEATFLTPRDGPIGPDTYIDITHESLIRQWKKLREEWLPEEQLSAKTFLDLTDRARNWKANKGELLAGLDLTGAVEWDRRRNKSPAWAEHYADETASRAVHEFITASQANERWRVFRRWAQWIAPLLLVVGAAGFVWYERDQRRHRAAQDALFRAQTELLRRVEFEKEATLGNAERVLREAELARIESQLATAGRVDTSVAPSPGTGSSAPTRPPAPRVYVQVRSQADAGDVTTGLIPRLQKAGFVVPKPEVLSTGPTSPEVRFFRSDEREDAGRIAQILQQAGIPDAQVRYVAGYEKSDRIRQKHFEVWLAPRDDGIRVPPVVGQSVQSANAMIARLGLRPKAEFNSIGRYAPNTIFGQQPREGSIVERGGVIHLYVEMELGPNELAAGRLFLSPTEVIDLDREGGTHLSWDVGLRTSGAGFYLEFGNGAQGVLLPGATRRATAFDATLCRTATDFTSRVQIPEPVAGQTVCAKTSLGRIAAIQLVELAKEPPELTIRYSTLRR